MTDALTVWGPGQLFAFSGIDGQTSYEFGLTLRSLTSGFEIKLPGEGQVTFPPVRSATFGMDWWELETDAGWVKGAFVDAYHVLIEGPVDVTEAKRNKRVHIVRKGGRILVGSLGFANGEVLDLDLDQVITSRRTWVQDRLKHWQPADRWAGLGLKALQQMKGMVYAPEGQFQHRATTPDRWPHRMVWLWDSGFHAIGYRHLDPALARDALDAVLDAQLPDGQIAICAGPFSTGLQRSQPPNLAWAVQLVNAVESPPGWLKACYPKLTAYLAWFERKRCLDVDGEPCFGWVEDGAKNEHQWSVCDESGMDNSARFTGTGVLRALDLCCLMAREYQVMAELAEQLGDDAEKWQQKADALCALIERDFWDEKKGIYCDVDHDSGNVTGIESVCGFYPLFLGSPSAERIDTLVEAMKDPTRFGTPMPLPSLPPKEPGYDKDMWNGPVWINCSWLILQGLRRCGQAKLADGIQDQTLDIMKQWQRELGCIFEFYDDQNETSPAALPRKGICDPESHPYHQVMHDFGWSATLAVDLMSTRNS